MKHLIRIAVALAVSLALSQGAQAAAPTTDAPQSYDLLQGIDASALDGVEMDAIHGALTGQDLYNALVAKAGLIQDPTLRAKVLAYLGTNQAQIVAFFDRLLSFRR